MAVGGPSWPNLQCLVRRKPATAGWAEDADRGGVQRLAKTLSIPHLVAIGVGSTIGAGIYVLVGTVAREHTGPGLTLSFLIAGVAAALSALCYAELSCRFPSAGSAYHYSYICIGESVAWLIGWALILEYTIGGSSVARGMSPNLALFFGGQDKLPFFLAQVHVKGLDTPVDPCAAILVLIVTALLCLGIKESSSVEGIITTANIIVMLFVICAGGWLGFRNGWVGYKVPEGYFPNGISGVLSGSATLFFAFIGFDTVASTAEEVKNPRRDLPLGMGLTLSLCCFLYMMVSAVVVGLVPYHAMDPDTPISSVFARYGMQWAEYVVSSGAVLALVASLIGGILPQPRIIMAMARDGLLPPLFSDVNRKTQVPILSTVLIGTCASVLAFFMDVSQLAGMVSVGTLLAFTAVAISVLVVRYAPPYEMPMEVALAVASFSGHLEHDEQNSEDPFSNGGLAVLGSSIVLLCIGQDKKFLGQTGALSLLGFMCPLVPFLPVCCIMVNLYLLMNVGSHTWIRVSIWLVAGALIYIFYGMKHSSLASMAYHRISPL
ncbi:Cationic amino acid transporter 2, vacuolar [Zea mays]|uniref:Cationic amino acid transporter 2, vacuolar n=2 Tax=Zea mays TaxID=4577 RepID=A0A3L6EKX3_MAIZE|nr:Cationic amino acid transporter 4 vacuolar [Zea mays]PWZ21319.1 Cationic amino acid transporter 2, vacuolar [Zea mays]